MSNKFPPSSAGEGGSPDGGRRSRRVRSRLTYANVTSSLALFLALGGGAAWAANEFTGRNIKDETLTGADVKGTGTVNGTLTTGDVKNGSLLKGDFKAGQLPAGPQGAKGATGPQGNPGPAGTARAYAWVAPDTGAGVPRLIHNKGFAGVRRTFTGGYCLELTEPASSRPTPTVSVEYVYTSSPEGDATAIFDALGCGGNEVQVRTYRRGPTTSAGLADDVGFTIIVP